MRYFVYCRKSSEAEDRQVLSIDSQKEELRSAFGSNPDIQILDVFEESYSAKAPGRAIFNDILDRIERGEADGIIAWHPDRLARNSIDGGRIIYLLDCDRIQDLKFATFTFENNPQGKFMLGITFANSKYYVDSLSQNVKRGNRAKIANGWLPNQAPIGYRNDKDTKTIIADPDHFPTVQKMFATILTGQCTINDLIHTANYHWGYRTPTRKYRGGGPLTRSTTYRMLTNPFYTGYIPYAGQLHPGKHPPAVSFADFQRVQELLGRPNRPKPQRHKFAYTGLIRCAACNQMVTAEHKVSRGRHHYLYYHCTKIRRPKCTQPSIEIRCLEPQIRTHLSTIQLAPPIQQWTCRQLAHSAQGRRRHKEQRLAALKTSIQHTNSQLATLTDLRVRGLLTDDEFSTKRQALQKDLYTLQQNRSKAANPQNPFESHQLLLFFSNQAIFWFDEGDMDVRRRILQIMASNLFLRDKKLSIQAKKPFLHLAKMAQKTELLAERDNIRNWSPAHYAQLKPLLSAFRAAAQDDDLFHALNDIKAIMAHFRVGLPPFPPSRP